MSNYHVEPIDQPQALTPQALKSLRQHPVQGISRRRLLRVSIGGGIALWLTEVLAGTVGFLWPNLKGGFGGTVKIGTLADIKLKNSSLPIDQGFPAYVQEARAYIVLIDTGRQQWSPGEDAHGDGTALNVRALYQRCPHLGCKPNPCLKNFWFECPCHGSRYDRLGIKALGSQYGPAPRSMDRFASKVDTDGTLTLDTSKITLGPLPVIVAQLIAGAGIGGHDARILDVGTGVGALAMAFCRTFPDSTVVGIDTWELSLELARQNVAAAGLGSRITLRAESIDAFEDDDGFDLVWMPVIFLSRRILEDAVAHAVAAMRPGAQIVLGRYAGPDDRIAGALGDLRTIRSGGTLLNGSDTRALLERAGLVDVHEVDRTWPAPIGLTAGRRR
jgi:Rieske Fe-S protein